MEHVGEAIISATGAAIIPENGLKMAIRPLIRL
jgi:hypothetical protein